ncbi:MAG: TRAP transporter substrate-binding protein [Deltaproteobacteria bacterium]|nr:TRAP transporter substrate-binding protein [Deltaproteobacteria bacterium]
MNKIGRIGFIAMFMALVFGTMASHALAQQMVIKMGHIYPPESLYSKTIERIAKNVDAHSNGKIKIQVYGSGGLGDWREIIEAMQISTVQMAFESVGTLDRYDPLPGIEAFPYLFRDLDHFKKFWFGPLAKQLHDDIAAKTKFRTVGAIYRGSRNLTCNREIKSIDDLKGLKLRVPPLKMYRATWEAFGASPVPMAFNELFTAMQQGIVDGQENPLVTIDDFKFNEVCKYLVMTKHVLGTQTYMFYEPWFVQLPKDVRELLVKDVEEGCAWANVEAEKLEESLKAGLVKKGMKLIEPDLAPYRAKTANIINDFPALKGYYDKIKAL